MEAGVEGGGAGAGGGVNTYGYLVHALRPVNTEETVSHRQNSNVKEVGTPPMRSNLCTSLITVSTAVRNKVTKTRSEEATVEEQLCSKTIHRAVIFLLLIFLGLCGSSISTACETDISITGELSTDHF